MCVYISNADIHIVIINQFEQQMHYKKKKSSRFGTDEVFWITLERNSENGKILLVRLIKAGHRVSKACFALKSINIPRSCFVGKSPFRTGRTAVKHRKTVH